ncbi:GTP-binding protein [Dehalobacterium formicoaceticum]|uniref:CobW family GTP-binding protein n=1 Tax=Dehalobacterium formicoaceticum TaxID=51515 RepID=UPI0031F60654
MTNMVKIDIISGFLGAGKTTLINKLLQEAYIGEKIALLENEFGEIAIDSDLFADYDIKVKEIANGCICCTLQGDFIKGIHELVREYAPDRIIIEPTGISHLKDTIYACNEAARDADIQLNCIITVVDAAMFPVFMDVSGEFYRQQVVDGRTIVLSAVQNLEENDDLDEIISGIRALNPTAPIIAEPYDEIDGLELLQMAEESGMLKECRHDHEHNHDHDHNCDGDHDQDNNQDHLQPRQDNEGFRSCSFRTDKVWTEAEISELFQKLTESSSGLIFRAKGFLNTESGMVKVNFVYGRGEIIPSTYIGPGKFVIIGKDLAETTLEKLFPGNSADQKLFNVRTIRS